MKYTGKRETGTCTGINRQEWPTLNSLSSKKILRQFTAEFRRAGRNFTLICLERRQWAKEQYLVPQEEIGFEILILDGDELAAQLDRTNTLSIDLLFLGGAVVKASRVASPLFADSSAALP